MEEVEGSWRPWSWWGELLQTEDSTSFETCFNVSNCFYSYCWQKIQISIYNIFAGIVFHVLYNDVFIPGLSSTHETCLQEFIAILKRMLENCNKFSKTCLMGSYHILISTILIIKVVLDYVFSVQVLWRCIRFVIG